jgi:peroxiredoxin
MRHSRSFVISAGIALTVACSQQLSAATVDDLLAAANASVPADEQGPGNAARAQAIAALVDTPGLAASDRIALIAAVAEAWLDVPEVVKAEEQAQVVVAAEAASEAVRVRAWLVLVAAWQVRAAGAEPGTRLPDLIAAVAKAPTAVRPRALVAVGRSQMARREVAALADFDAALTLLAQAPTGERVPVYALRLTAMEEAGAKPEAIRAWLATKAADPAAGLAAETALSAGEQLTGRPAPPLRLPRLDGQPGEIVLAPTPGKPVLVWFFTTWHQPCGIVAPAITAIASTWQARGLSVIGVSLDNRDTLPGMPGWLARHGVTYPVGGESLGWDAEAAAAWHIEAVPQIFLVGGAGNIVAAGLGGATTAEVTAAVTAAVERELASRPEPALPSPASSEVP